MLSGDNSILQKATDAKQTSERAEAKEQAQIDIMAYIADKTANHQDASIDDAKVKDILTGKSYVKTANDTSFTTAKGEYVIPYSELYTASDKTPTTPNSLSTEWEIVSDFGATGLSVGDIVQPTIPGVTTEQFYVIGIDGTGDNQTVRLLAKYCVNTESTVNKQDLNAEGLAFDESSPYTNVYANSDTIKEKVEEYANWLNDYLTLENVEIEEGGNAVEGVKGRLMWGNKYSGETKSLLAINVSGITGSTIIYGDETDYMGYWLGTPSFDPDSYVGVVYDVRGGTNRDIYDQDVNSHYPGLRPVIKILASKIS